MKQLMILLLLFVVNTTFSQGTVKQIDKHRLKVTVEKESTITLEIYTCGEPMWMRQIHEDDDGLPYISISENDEGTIIKSVIKHIYKKGESLPEWNGMTGEANEGYTVWRIYLCY